MIFSYEEGTYQEGDKNIEGVLTLGEHKVYLRKDQQDLAATYVPLEKIGCLKLAGHHMKLHVKPTVSSQYWACFGGKPHKIKELAIDIVQRRGLKKRFLKKEWFEEPC